MDSNILPKALDLLALGYRSKQTMVSEKWKKAFKSFFVFHKKKQLIGIGLRLACAERNKLSWGITDIVTLVVVICE